MEGMFKWFAVLGRLSNQYADQRLRRLDINSSHHVFIMHICENPGLTQESLRLMVHIHPSNVSRALDYLEKHEFITKETLAEDKRTSKLYPTQKAKECYPIIIKMIDDWVNLVTKDFNQEEKDQFLALLQRSGKNAVDHFFNI